MLEGLMLASLVRSEDIAMASRNLVVGGESKRFMTQIKSA